MRINSFTLLGVTLLGSLVAASTPFPIKAKGFVELFNTLLNAACSSLFSVE